MKLNRAAKSVRLPRTELDRSVAMIELSVEGASKVTTGIPSEAPMSLKSWFQEEWAPRAAKSSTSSPPPASHITTSMEWGPEVRDIGPEKWSSGP